MGTYKRPELLCKIRKGIFEDMTFKMRPKRPDGVMGSLNRGSRHVKAEAQKECSLFKN